MAVAVTSTGEVHVVGRLGYHGYTDGFIAVRRKLRWQVMAWPSTVRAVVASGRGALAVAGERLVSCGRRCKNVPRPPETLRTLVIGPKGPLAAADSGALYALRGRRLKRVVAAPGFGPSLGQVVQGKRGVVALFGPVIAGSEYHPFCVASTVARLGPGGWQRLHRVAGARGRRLDCQPGDDSRPPVVVDIAVAGSTVYARRLARRAGAPPGFRLLVRLPRP